ncbi:DUF3427 domain-containing protein [Streptomyces sp. NPDC059255]|uniref:DUF3427 domain-containing protein n=1 Tax=Streptomyces sp. NPDC059255 TaxID=3346793 RepID=UPI0036C38778
MTDALNYESSATGLYEQLITLRLQEAFKKLDDLEARAIYSKAGIASTSHALARNVTDIVRRVLQGLPTSEHAHAANHILESVSNSHGFQEWVDMALPTKTPEKPSLDCELRAEISTTDRLDLMFTSVKWHDVHTLEGPFLAAHKRGVPIRVITTTHLGITERLALDHLVQEFDAEVKVKHDPRSTQLNAKMWLFRRNSGYNTAYVDNSQPVETTPIYDIARKTRFSSITTPEKMEASELTFDSYWNEPTFASYDPAVHTNRLDEDLQRANGSYSTAKNDQHSTYSTLKIYPYPHQQDMLERLAVERDVHDRHLNLLVAATGTGKTVMAALDYQTLRAKFGQNPRLLFIAHRKEILEQSIRTFRSVLDDETFGELLVGGEIPFHWNHVFASVQSLNARTLDRLASDHFDVVVIDEFHHGTAPTYRKIFHHFTPIELLGLTATPERTDGSNIQDEFFDGRIAAEMRLWEALDNELLSPFHYFGITDTTDLTAIQWKRGSYDPAALSEILTGNVSRAQLVLKSIEERVTDPKKMRALGFCVSVAHAHFMAESFQEAGLNSIALSGETPGDQRKCAVESLKSGDLQVIFSVDLFNEGLDIPNVDTLILLRPTSSSTVFLQQLGRGLRRCEGKSILTVLDFIGQHRKEFRFEDQFRALTNLTRNRLVTAINQDFPQLPSTCQITLEPKAKSLIIDNIRSQIAVNVNQLANEVRQFGALHLAEYLKESGREVKELYKGTSHSWTALLRRTKLLPEQAPEGEIGLLRRASALLHVDDPARAAAYTLLLEDDSPSYNDLTDLERAYARMLFFTLWPLGGFDTYQAGLASLRPQHAVRSELRQVLAHVLEHVEHITPALPAPHHTLPLRVHASYSREEILAGLGESTIDGLMPAHFREGVRWCEAIKTDALLITLEKDEKDFSPQTRYKDYAMSDSRFHWESQNQTSESSPTGIRYRSHQDAGTHVLLFVRRYKKTDIGGPQPWILLGPADYASHTGSKPMGIVWKLRSPLPADVWTYSAVTGAGISSEVPVKETVTGRI